MLLKNLIVPLLATTANVTATFDLTTSLTKYASFDFGCGDISISKGAEFSLINKFESSFQGDISIEKDCKFFLASTAAKALKVTVSGLFNKIVNKGIWVVHSLDAIKSATCNIVGASFENTGQCIFAVKAEIVKIVSLKWINSGCLHFYQDIKSLCVAEIGAWLGFLTNHGTICLTNYKCKNSASIIGSGCIAIEKDSSFYIANSLLQIDTKHTFYLGAGNPTIQASPNVFPQTFNVANFGGSHKIGLDCPLASASFFGQKAFSYDSKKGILTLRANGMASQNFKIGLGYDEKKFSICSDDSIGAVSVKNGAVQYNGPCPNPGRPTICLACPPPPEVPGTTPCTTTSTITSTKTNGQICTEIDEVIISTDATGSWFTSTSTTVNCGQTSEATSIPHTQVTVTSTYTGLTTATTTVSGSSTDTVYVEVPSVPHSQVTTTTTSTGITEVTATTITGTSTDTVLVIVPATTASTSTVTNTWTGSFTTTVTTGDLVIVEVPSSDFSSTVSTSTTAETTSTEGETAETGTTEDETASTATTEGETGNGQFSTSYVTVTAETTSFITITSCSNNGCHQTTAPTGVTVVTVTESDVSTVFTTYCPLTQTHTLGVSKSSTVDLGCPTGYFGYDGLPGKNIHFDFSLSKSIGFYVEANKFINIGSHHKREESNSTKSGSSSSANAGAMNTIYGVEFLSAVAIVLAFVF